jgi:hypothetical protein
MPSINLDSQDNEDWISNGKIMVSSSSDAGYSGDSAMINGLPMPFIMG